MADSSSTTASPPQNNPSRRGLLRSLRRYAQFRAGLIEAPTVFHVTHWKAGSQWVRNLMASCYFPWLVDAKDDNSQVLIDPIQPGKFYAAVYVTRELFDKMRKPPGSRHFVIVRDLRDTLVSAYFSLKISHPADQSSLPGTGAAVASERGKLQQLDVESGMIQLMDDWLPHSANIQQSWFDAGEKLLHYEDLLCGDADVFTRLLVDELDLPIPRWRLAKAITANRFESLTGGRPRGTEDVSAHWRKGIAGDWKNHFTDRVKDAFKSRYGRTLIATGYEKDDNW